MRGFRLAVTLCALVASATAVGADTGTLPATPSLPAPSRSGDADVNGVRLWYAVFGDGPPVVLLHGGLANADYWGRLVPELAKTYRVVVIDSRGHGRSTRDARPFDYHVMASDVRGVMDHLSIAKAAIVGWSDGGIIGLDLAIHHPERVTRVFAFAANSDPSAVKDATGNPIFDAYLVRTKYEYLKRSPTPDRYDAFLADITKMWETQPHFTAEQLKSIRVPVWIVSGDRDELVKRENTLFMADTIPGASLLIQASVGHFSFLQDPRQFIDDVLRFVAPAETKGATP